MKSFSDYIVDINRLQKNADNIRSCLNSGVKMCAVVKANAYGIGLESVCKALKGRVDFFACACLKEALQIRVFDKKTKILVLGCVDEEDYKIIEENNISISIGSLNQVNSILNKEIKHINIHLQVNTGLNRFGFRSINVFKDAIKKIENDGRINIEGVYSHFATKSEDVGFMNKQYFRFLQFKKILKGKDILFHIANSYGLVHSNKFHFDMVRSGFLLYGFMENNIGNTPVMQIKSKIIHILDLKTGDSVGYSRTFKTNKSMKLGIVPLGYADGINRQLSNKFSVLIGGVRCKIVGMICMDVFMVDLSNVKAKLYDEVVIIGNSKGQEITIQEMANVIGTSPYEVLCDFNYKRMNYLKK
ncbi:MAG: alanine racemase [Clostridia bacterium]|nr:alanine racemase [Clostridia bacterium]